MEKEPSYQWEIESIPFQLNLKLKVNPDSCPESGTILFYVDGGEGGRYWMGVNLHFYRTDSRIYFSTESVEDAMARGRIVP